MHEGQDLPAACGTPLIAARGGRVAATGYSDALYGYYVLIDGLATDHDYFYAHLQAPTPLREGDRVRTGERDRRVGKTGNARNEFCQLHFELWPHGYHDGAPDATRSRRCGAGTPSLERAGSLAAMSTRAEPRSRGDAPVRALGRPADDRARRRRAARLRLLRGLLAHARQRRLRDDRRPLVGQLRRRAPPCSGRSSSCSRATLAEHEELGEGSGHVLRIAALIQGGATLVAVVVMLALRDPITDDLLDGDDRALLGPGGRARRLRRRLLRARLPRRAPPVRPLRGAARARGRLAADVPGRGRGRDRRGQRRGGARHRGRAARQPRPCCRSRSRATARPAGPGRAGEPDAGGARVHARARRRLRRRGAADDALRAGPGQLRRAVRPRAPTPPPRAASSTC